jgi:phosphoglycolate phosphatase-like HAD superfamily hydrolase
LHAAGVRIGVVTDAPLELVDVALAHVGAARQVDVVGTADEVSRELGGTVMAVSSRRLLLSLR